MHFSEAYKAPYSNRLGVYIFCDGGSMAFTVLTYDRKDDLDRAVALLNGDPSAVPFKFVGIDETNTYIGVGDDEETAKKPYLMVRGWGHLTGVGGLHLPVEEAIAVQDSFFKFACKKLKGEKYGE